VSPQVKASKKATKKAKAREKKAGNAELDQALAELSLKYALCCTVHVYLF
jgi:hypothetical protein